MVAFFIFLLALFPGVLVWAWQSGKERRLFAATGALLLLLVAISFALASPRFGNRLTDSYGYMHITTNILMLLGLTAALPLVSAAFFISLAGKFVSRASFLYMMSIAVAAIMWIAGLLLSFYFLSRFERSS